MEQNKPEYHVVSLSGGKDSTAMLLMMLERGSHTGSYLTIEPAVGSEVPVGVWAVTEADEQALDRYEGYPNFYYKKELTLPITGIRTGKVRQRNAFVYIMHEERRLGTPSEFYLQTCVEGYRNFGFELEVLFEAYRYSTEGN